MYSPRRVSRSDFVPLRKLRYHVRTWGEPRPGVPPLVMVHGWMDVAASWQFVVDAFAQGRHVIAPDWRGFGLTDGPPCDNYWFPDYLADLDFLLDHYAGETPVDLVGHSMGGNIAMVYAGVRPERIRRLVNLEGFGMPASRPSQAPGRYAKWISELKAHERGALALKSYDSLAGVAARLMKTNRRLSPERAEWLAGHWAAQQADGRWAVLGDAAHKIVNANLYRVDEAQEIFRAIRAPLLAMEAEEESLSQWWQGRYSLAEYHERLKAVSDVRISRIADAGHMLHHDQPLEVARRIEAFLQEERPGSSPSEAQPPSIS